MAITITNANANINDSTLTYTLTFTGKTQPNVYGRIKVNGNIIGSATGSGATSIAVTFTKTALYDAATGYSPTDAVIFEVQELDADFVPVGSISQKTGGDITINGRLSTLTLTTPTTANPINLDLANPVNVALNWARPENNAAFFGRIKFYVWDGSAWVRIFNWSPYATSISVDLPTWELADDAERAMNLVSPRKIRVEVITVFKFASYTDLSGTPLSKEVTDGIIKSFYDGSKVGVHNGTSWVDHESYVYDGTTWKLAQVYVYNGSNWIESL